MLTSYFSKISRNPEIIKKSFSIALKSPFPIKNIPELAPTFLMLKKGYNKQDYKDLILNIRKINLKEIYEKYKNNILLCWEKDNSNCHRKYLSEILEEELNIEVKEL